MLHTFHNPLIALHEVTINLLSEEDPAVLLERILDQAIDATHADSGSIALLDSERKFLEIKAYRGLSSDVSERVKLKLGEGVTGRCILTGKRRNVGDTRQDPHYIEVRSDIRSELAIPLKIGSKSFGVISVDSEHLNAFTVEHEEFLELLANYAAQIFTSKQALSNLNHRTEIQSALLEMSSELGRSPNIEEVYNKLMSILQKRTDIISAAIHIYDSVSQELFIIASTNYSEEQVQRGVYHTGEGVTGQVFKQKKAINIPDIASDTVFLNKTGVGQVSEKTSFFAAPIVLDSEAKGVFSLMMPYKSESVFEDYGFLVQILSSLFSQAIRIQNLIEERSNEVKYENINLKRQLQEKFSFDSIVGNSEKMKELFDKIIMASDSASSILVTGESGTGKELIATSLHQNSIRKDKNLVKLNCAAIPSDLLENELFGSVKGAYTGSVEDRKGKVLMAHNGTLFLDEIGEMDYRLQSKLLRVLQEKEFSPLGSNKVYKVDVRIIAATNANLEKLVKEKKFREDLYYRLNVLRLDIPPLRERKEDLPVLIQYLVKKICRNNRKPVKTVAPDAMSRLERYEYPGNVRELENLLERAIILSQNRSITAADIQLLHVEKPVSEKTDAEPAAAGPVQKTAGSYDLKSWIRERLENSDTGKYRYSVISEVEKQLIKIVLQNNLFNKTKTAKMLGINRLTLDRKISEYNILDEMTGY